MNINGARSLNPWKMAVSLLEFMGKKKCVLLLALISLMLCAPRLGGPLDFRYDGGVYYILGTSLAEGKGYRLLNEPGEIQAVQYPPLFPCIIAVHQLLLRSKEPWLAGVSLNFTFCGLFLAYAVAIYCFARRYCTPFYSFLSAFVCLLDEHAYFFASLCFAEIPFALITILFMLANRRRNSPAYFALTALLAMAAYLLRGPGIALLAAWVIESLFKREFKAVFMRTALAAIPVIFWTTYIARVEAGPEYKNPAYGYQRAAYQHYNVSYAKNMACLDPFKPELGKTSFRELVRRSGRHAVLGLSKVGEAITARVDLIDWEPWRALLRSCGLDRLEYVDFEEIVHGWLSLLVVAGMAGLFVKGDRIVWLYALGSFAVICLSPWPRQFNRYLMPVAPFIAVAFFLSLQAFGDYCALSRRVTWRRIGRVFAGIVLFLLVVPELFFVYKNYGKRLNEITNAYHGGGEHTYRLHYFSGKWRDYDLAVEWLKKNARPTDIVATTNPHWVYLRTGLRAVLPPFEPDPVMARDLLASVPATYVVIDNLTFLDVSRRYAAPVARKFPRDWQEVFTTPGGVSVYSRRKF